jgi:hypothetical protein
VSCGSTGVTESFCEETQGSACLAAYYEASNGVSYSCASCSDCGTASSDMSSYCASLTESTSCSSAVSCGSDGVTDTFCETLVGGTCSSAYYTTSSGEEYVCASCSDCSSAVSSLDSYCSSMQTTESCGSSTSCGSLGYTYQVCEVISNGSCSELWYATSTGQTYVCSSCSDCSTAETELDSFCEE